MSSQGLGSTLSIRLPAVLPLPSCWKEVGQRNIAATKQSPQGPVESLNSPTDLLALPYHDLGSKGYNNTGCIAF